MHHFFLKRFTFAFRAPECSVPAIGCPGISTYFLLFNFKVFLENIFFTEPTSDKTWFGRVYLESCSIIPFILPTGVHIKITSLFWTLLFYLYFFI